MKKKGKKKANKREWKVEDFYYEPSEKDIEEESKPYEEWPEHLKKEFEEIDKMLEEDDDEDEEDDDGDDD